MSVDLHGSTVFKSDGTLDTSRVSASAWRTPVADVPPAEVGVVELTVVAEAARSRRKWRS